MSRELQALLVGLSLAAACAYLLRTLLYPAPSNCSRCPRTTGPAAKGWATLAALSPQRAGADSGRRGRGARRSAALTVLRDAP